MSEKSFDIIIIGAGIAGMTAAIYAKRAEKNVLVLESKIHGGQIVEAHKVGNWPGDPGISGVELTTKMYNQVKEIGVPVEYEEVLEVSREDSGFLVRTDEGEYLSRAIIVASGTVPRRLGEKQTREAGKRPISYCATCDGALYKGKPVVVVGSGNTAKMEIEYLSNIASEVYHIHHDDPIPEEAVAIFAAIGREPATEFLKGVVELDADGYIKAGEDCLTSVPGIFAAGDVRTKGVRQLVTAAGDGAVAAQAAVRLLG